MRHPFLERTNPKPTNFVVLRTFRSKRAAVAPPPPSPTHDPLSFLSRGRDSLCSCYPMLPDNPPADVWSDNRAENVSVQGVRSTHTPSFPSGYRLAMASRVSQPSSVAADGVVSSDVLDVDPKRENAVIPPHFLSSRFIPHPRSCLLSLVLTHKHRERIRRPSAGVLQGSSIKPATHGLGRHQIFARSSLAEQR